MKTNQIFALVRTPAPPSRPSTPDEIVAAIRRPSALQLADHELSSLHDRREVAATALRDAIALGPGVDESAANARIATLARSLQDLDQQIVEQTLARDKARKPHCASIASALAPLERAAIGNAVAAIDNLVAALATIDAVAREVQKAGGPIFWRFPLQYRSAVAALRGRLRARGGA